MPARIMDLPSDPGSLSRLSPELIATNSLLLHELYFGSLGGDGVTMTPAARLMLDASFGSVDRWRDEFTAMARALGGGSGWVLLVFQPREGTLVNRCGADHTHALAGGVPILALDMHEHAYHKEYGDSADAHVDAFTGHIDWAAVHARYQRAVHAAGDALGMNADDLGDELLLDVRRSGVFEQAPTTLPGARWRDPSSLPSWVGDLPRGRRVVVYCVHGHEVSRSVALRLRASGLDAHFLRGGIDAWQVAGRPLVDRPGGPIP